MHKRTYLNSISRILLFCAIALIPVRVFSFNTFTSVGAGGNWNNPASWLASPFPGGFPGAGDTVIIAAASPITVNVVSAAKSINIQSGATLTISKLITLSGSLQLDGTATGAGEIDLTNVVNNMFIGGSHATTTTGNIVLRGGGGTTVFIRASVVWNNNPGIISLSSTTTVNNSGSMTTGYLNSAAPAGATWINAANSQLTVNKNFVGPIALTALANGNTVTYSGTCTNVMTVPYWNLTLSSTNTYLLNGATTVIGDMSISAFAALNGNGFSLSVGGNFLNFRSVTNLTNVDLIMNGSGKGLFKAAGGVETFRNLTITSAGTVTMFIPVSILANLNVTSGTFDVNSPNYPLAVSGNITINGIFNPRAGVLTLNGVATQTISGTGCTFFNVISNSTSVLLGSAFSAAGSLTLNTGTFDVGAGNNSVSVKAALVIKNTFTARSGKVTLNGIAAQTLSGTSAAFYDLTLNNAAGVTISTGAWTIADALTAQLGVIKQTGAATVTLLSNSVTTAYTGSGAGSYSGTFIIQRFIAGRVANWQDLACPVTGTTLTDWDNEMFISGVGGPDGTSCCPTFYSVNTYNEATEAIVNVTSEIALVPGVGYQIWAADDASNWNAKNIDTRGTPVSGNKLVNLTCTAGADAGDNRIGNPYASHITWNSALGTNVQSTIYVLQNGSYVAYGNGTVIPSHQGFIAYANAGGGSITFTEACKSASTASSWGRSKTTPHNLTFMISSPALTDYYQENFVDFNDNAGLGFDVDYDHRFITSPETKAPSLCMVAADGKRLTLNSFSASANETMAIPMKMTVGIDGNYQLQTTGAANMGEYSCALLEDLQAHKVIDLKQNADYSFNAKTTDSPDRFILHLSRKSTSCEEILTAVKPADAFFTDNQVLIYGNDGSAIIHFDLDQNTKATVSVFDLQGRCIINEQEIVAYKETLNLKLPENASGLYLVNVNLGGNHMISKKIILNR
jgi:hypothetical protein